MIYHNNTFEALAKAPVKRTDTIVVLQDQDPYGYHDNNSVKWTSSDALMSVTIDAVGAFIGTVTKKATVKLMGIVNSANSGNVFQIRFGLFDSTPGVNAFNYISQGFFIVDNVSYDYEAGSTTVVMYDAMWTATTTPYSTNLVYPCTVANLAAQVASGIDADLMANMTSLPNANFVVESDLFAKISNATLQTVIQEIAATTGTIARMSNMTLTFVPFSQTNQTLDSSVLKKLSIGNQYGPVTSVVLGRMPQNDNVAVANPVSSSSFITAVDTTANLFTITGNNMGNGTLVQVSSTGTLPAPLQAGTNYFVFTNGNANTFALTPTYSDGVAGSNIIDITTAGTGTMTLSQLQRQEVQINNIQIMDNDRQTMLPPLYNALVGIGWNASKSETIGLGYFEVGDVVKYQQGSVIVSSLLSEVHVTIDGAIQEALISTIPDAQTINYQTAGGILKTIYDTEIKVDKQNNDITSVVSQQQIYADQTLNKFTEVYQAIDGVTTQVQSVGGGNLILNSVGYAKETNGSLSFWTASGTGTVTSYSSASSLAAGATSGSAIDLVGSSVQILQRINVATSSTYSVGFRVNKAAADGSARLYLTNAVTSFYIDILAANKYTWQELKLENIIPGQNYWDVKLVITAATSGIEVTDLRVMLGTTLPQWSQSNSEILNTQVALTTQGIRVSSSVNNGDYTTMTPVEFAGYTSVTGTSKKVFTVNRETTMVEGLQVGGKATFGVDGATGVDGFVPVIRAIASSSGPLAGLSFVGAVS